jgi:hypothetical protein
VNESETGAALRRAGRRAAFHLLRAALEGLKAVEVLVDELSKVGRPASEDEEEGGSPGGRVHIDVE